MQKPWSAPGCGNSEKLAAPVEQPDPLAAAGQAGKIAGPQLASLRRVNPPLIGQDGRREIEEELPHRDERP